MTNYRPIIMSTRMWLSVLALCFYASEVSAKVHTHYHSTTQICYDKFNKQIPCPKSKKNMIIGLIIAGSLLGVFVLGGILYCCCCAGEVACATCAACCCLCCGKRKKTSGGQVYQTLPEQGNSTTVPQSTYTPNTMSYSYPASTSDAPYDPPQAGASAFSGPSPYEKYDTNTAVASAAHGHGEAASYYNNTNSSYNSLPELKYDYRSTSAEGAPPPPSKVVSVPQPEVPPYQPPSYPPSYP